MGKRARRRTREQVRRIEDRRKAAAAVTECAPAWVGASLAELRRLVATQAVISDRIDDAIDALASVGVGWVPIGEALGVTRQAARQAYLKHRITGA
jgi:hypothetical protein